MNSLEQIRDIIYENSKFILMGHIDPDGDCIGSLFAMKWYLDNLKKSSIVLLSEKLDDRYDVLNFSNDDYSLFNNFVMKENVDYVCLALDTADIDRLGEGKVFAENSYLVNIDHHLDNPVYGAINYINPDKAAVGEIIFDLIALDEKWSLDKMRYEKKLNTNNVEKIANALALAIIGDTGSFRYQNTSSAVFSIMSLLTDLGVDTYQINKSVYGSYPYNQIKLKALALNTLELTTNGKVAYLIIDQAMLEETNTSLDEVSGLVNYARDIKGVELGLLFSEVNEYETRVSFRSNKYCMVNELAALFGGGGHPRAAGCTIDKSLLEAKDLILNKVDNYV
ncbi:MAG: DHH family phosphoesterase [Halanaerobiales bacterium]